MEVSEIPMTPMHKRTGRVALVLFVVVFLATTVSAQQSASGTFKQNARGEWETSVLRADGTSEVFTFTPPDLFIAQVTTVLELAEPRGGVVRYRYQVGNDPRSAQSISFFFMGAGDRTAIWLDHATAPAGWEARLAFYTIDSPLLPGSDATFGGDAAAFPGVVSLEFMADTADTEMPVDFSDRQAREFQEIRSRTVQIFGIGPKFALGLQPLSTFLVSVGPHFEREFKKSGHPGAVRLGRILAKPATTTKERGDLLAELLETSRLPTSDVWHKSLSEALSVCVSILLASRD